MNYDWPTFFASIGGSAVVGLGAAYAIVQTFFKKKIEAEVQSKYDEALANLNAKNSQELECFKAAYKKSLDENQIRFSKWHDAQAEVIREMYGMLSELKIATTLLVDSIYPPNIDAEKIDKNNMDRYLEAYKSSNLFYHKNKILFPEEHVNKLDALFKKVLLSSTGHMMNKAMQKSQPEASELHFKIAKENAHSVGNILDDLRKEFRAILNGEEVQNAE